MQYAVFRVGCIRGYDYDWLQGDFIVYMYHIHTHTYKFIFIYLNVCLYKWIEWDLFWITLYNSMFALPCSLYFHFCFNWKKIRPLSNEHKGIAQEVPTSEWFFFCLAMSASGNLCKFSVWIKIKKKIENEMSYHINEFTCIAGLYIRTCM